MPYDDDPLDESPDGVSDTHPNPFPPPPEAPIGETGEPPIGLGPRPPAEDVFPADDERYSPVRLDRRVVLAGLLIAGAGMLLLLILFSAGDSGPDPDVPRPTTAAPEFIERPSDAPPYGDARTGEVLDPAADPAYGYGDPYGDPYASAYPGPAQTDYAVTQPSPAPYTASGSSNPTPASSRRSSGEGDPLAASFDRAVASPLLTGTGAPVRTDGATRPELPEGLSPETEQEIYELQAIAAALAPPTPSGPSPFETGAEPTPHASGGGSDAASPLLVDPRALPDAGGPAGRAGVQTREAFQARTAGLGPTAYGVRAERPAHALVLTAGTVVPAALMTGIDSELPGAVVAQVTRNVYDSRTQRDVLIPAGSRLIGEYDDQVAYGQNRALVAWTRLLLPDGRSVSLPGLPTKDLRGQSGLHDRVDRHTARLFGSAVLLAAVGAGVDLAAPDGVGILVAQSPQETAARQVAIELSRVATEVVRRDLDVQPTVSIRPGFRFYVFLARDLAFAAPYRERADVGRFPRSPVSGPSARVR